MQGTNLESVERRSRWPHFTIWTAFLEPEHLVLQSKRWVRTGIGEPSGDGEKRGNQVKANVDRYVAGRLRWPNFTIWTAFFESEHLERWSYFELNIPNARTAQQYRAAEVAELHYMDSVLRTGTSRTLVAFRAQHTECEDGAAASRTDAACLASFAQHRDGLRAREDRPN